MVPLPLEKCKRLFMIKIKLINKETNLNRTVVLVNELRSNSNRRFKWEKLSKFKYCWITLSGHYAPIHSTLAQFPSTFKYKHLIMSHHVENGSQVLHPVSEKSSDVSFATEKEVKDANRDVRFDKTDILGAPGALKKTVLLKAVKILREKGMLDPMKEAFGIADAPDFLINILEGLETGTNTTDTDMLNILKNILEVIENTGVQGFLQKEIEKSMNASIEEIVETNASKEVDQLNQTANETHPKGNRSSALSRNTDLGDFSWKPVKRNMFDKILNQHSKGLDMTSENQQDIVERNVTKSKI